MGNAGEKSARGQGEQISEAQPSQAIVQRDTGTTKIVARLLTEQWKSVLSLLPEHVTPERFARVALTAINRTPKLAECSPQSLAQAIMDAATMGLEVNDGTGRAYLVPYRSRERGMMAQLIVGYPGLVELCYRSERVLSIYSQAVFEGDDFLYCFGLESALRHVPSGETRADRLTHVYTVVRLQNGGYLFEVMTREQVDGIRSRSPSALKGPWVTDYVEMARKSCTRKACKMVPKSAELSRAVRYAEIQEHIKSLIDESSNGVSDLDQLTDHLRERSSRKRITGHEALPAEGVEPEPPPPRESSIHDDEPPDDWVPRQANDAVGQAPPSRRIRELAEQSEDTMDTPTGPQFSQPDRNEEGDLF